MSEYAYCTHRFGRLAALDRAGGTIALTSDDVGGGGDRKDGERERCESSEAREHCGEKLLVLAERLLAS